MFLCLYSGGPRKHNEPIDLQVVNRIGKKGEITYIPSDSNHPDSASFFENFKRYFGYYGIRRIRYFCHDRPFRAADVGDAFNSDAVYLSGGNTFSFRQGLQRVKLDSKLRAFVAKGGSATRTKRWKYYYDTHCYDGFGRPRKGSKRGWS